MILFRRPLMQSAAFAAVVMLSAPCFAQAPSPPPAVPASPPAAASPAPMPAAAPPTAPAAPVAQAAADPIDAHIAELKEKLEVTTAERKEWAAIAKVIRKNAESTRDLVKEKRSHEETMTAVEDLRAYADIAENHAAEMRRLAKSFESLYAVMSDSQKKVADEYFRAHKREAAASREKP